MALLFVLDEHLRGPLWQGIQRHNTAGVDVLDVLRVGGTASLPLGTSDPDILIWCEIHGRILITADWTTMPGHLTQHHLAGHHTSGVVFLKRGWKVASVIASLVLYQQALAPADFLDRTEYIA